MWYREMPDRGVEIIRGKMLAPGGDLVKLASEYSRPTMKVLII